MRALALASLALLAACGDGLYDAEGLPVVQVQPNTCDANQVVCADDTTNTCRQETVSLCGSTCSACPAGPAGTLPVCNLGRAADGHGQCGYVCADGFFACNTNQCCPVVAVAAGGDSSYAIVSDGTVRGWGANEAGQLGDGSVIDRLVPALVKLPAGTTASAVAAGPDHACAVVTGGAVRCWGTNTSGQVSGAPTSGVLSSPTATPVTSGALAVAAGASHTCALLSSGSVTCWGSNAVGQLGGASAITGATAIAAGKRHTCAVVAGGAVKCWGANDQGQLGASPSGGVATPIAAGIQRVAAYGDHTCAATDATTGDKIVDGVRCWGAVLGAAFAFAEPQTTPAIPMKDAEQSTIRKPVAAIATGRTHVCLVAEQKLQCFGTDNALGQLGNVVLAGGETDATDVPALAPGAFATGDDHACVILGTGALRCWGDNGKGQLGDDTTTTPDVGILRPPKGT